MSRRLSFSVTDVGHLEGTDEVVLSGEVWLGPLDVGDTFDAAYHEPNQEVPIRLVVTRILAGGDVIRRAPSGEQVQVLIGGHGLDQIAGGDVLLGERVSAGVDADG